MTLYLNNDYDVMNCFAKFEKFLAHGIIIQSFMTIGSQMPELDRGGFFVSPPPPPYKIRSQTTPYKLGLNKKLLNWKSGQNFSIPNNFPR